MTWRLLRETLWHRRGRAALALLAITVGTVLSMALVAVSSNILDRMGQELRSYGANISVTPRSERIEIEVAGVLYSPPSGSAYIDERELVKLKTIFWRNQITGFTPFLSIPISVGESRQPTSLTGTWFDKEVSLAPGAIVRTAFAEETVIREKVSTRTGVRSVSPWWQVTGAWPGEDSRDEVLLGSSLADRLGVKTGDTLGAEHDGKASQLRVVGILSTGGFEDDQVVSSLALAQDLHGLSYGASRVLVGAMVQPKEKLAPELRNKKPEEMTPREYEIWYCSPVIEAVAKQIEEVVPGSQALPIRQIAEAEGTFLVKLEGLMVLITIIALAVSILGVMATLHSTIVERRADIGLMKALGAQDWQVTSLFLYEAAALGAIGGLVGFALGSLLAGAIGEKVFGSAIPPNPALLPLALILALVISLVGSGLPIRQAIKIEPVKLLKSK